MSLHHGDDGRSSSSVDTSEAEDAEKVAHPGHPLSSTRPGQSEAELVAKRIEKRLQTRIAITFGARVRFLQECRQISQIKGYESAQIQLDDLRQYRDRVQNEVDSIHCHQLAHWLGIRLDRHSLLQLLERALELMDTTRHLFDDEWFAYKEFSFFHTRIESRWPWMRTDMRLAVTVSILYYLLTPILFCHIIEDSNICGDDGNGNSYRGWVTGLYFASTTVSTVGYGDYTVQRDTRWRTFVAALYMIISVVVSILAVGAAANAVFVPFESMIHRIVEYFLGKERRGEFLYKQIRRVKFMRLAEIAVQFFLLNLLGVFADRIDVVVRNSDVPWMTSFYWAIQTTTTIGYGDTVALQSFEMQWFKIFYLILSTYSVGNALGRLRDLKEKLKLLRREHAWERSKVTQRYIEETQAYQNDNKVDQYEFLVASLLTLGKISTADVTQVMNKFRDLAGAKGYISITEDAETNDNASTTSYDEEDVVHHEE